MAVASGAVGPTGELATFLASAGYVDLPAPAREHAKMAIASTLASAAAGARFPSVEIVRALAAERGGAAEATAWWADGLRIPTAEAARVNAMCSDAAASDDSDARTIAHLGTAVVAAALAAAERAAARGRDVITAVAVGYEAAGRVGEAARNRLTERSMHPAALSGFGAAASAARLLAPSAERLRDALALAATTAAGVLAGRHGWMREYQAGSAVCAGVQAALAAAAGLRADPAALEGPGGFLEVACAEPDADALRRRLGDAWDIETELGVKLRPGGYPFAAAVEAAIEASRALGAAPEEIERIRVAAPWAEALAGPRHPRAFVEAIHSLPYYVAAGACHGEFGWDALDEHRIDDPMVWRLLDLVEVTTGDDREPRDSTFPFPATVTVVARSGASARATVDLPQGTARRGLAWPALEDKLCTLLQRAGRAAVDAERLTAVLRRLDDVDDIGELTAMLA